MSKRVHRFPLFSITASLHIKSTSALMLWRGLTQVTHIKLLLFFQTTRTGQCGLLHVLFISRTLLSLFFSLSLLRIVVSLNTCLVYSTLGVLLHTCC
ncbi:unnamed protein product [Hymenolepis diminuta]|uniref:Uncharacterized protein n=1 Tax=Hymenolepis diminuta TaxID=6216 RepID=A0A564YI12_HYMDI|nr:unnamed protein product [Hymenolepis diminuta]